MTATKEYKPVPVWERSTPPAHPGEILRDILEDERLTQVKLAKEIGVSFRAVNEIVNGKRGITPEMALRLARRFDTTPQFWLNLQANYELWKAAKKLEMVSV
jgi:addiction module HigA family antidote